MRDTFREIAKYMDPVNPVTTAKELLKMHTIDASVGLAEVWRRHNHRQSINQRFFVFNTFLMDIPFSRKPAVEQRDSEIGQYTSRNFDICCLSEVWHRQGFNDIKKYWDKTAHIATNYKRTKFKLITMKRASGLMTISKKLDIIKTHFHAYNHESGDDKMAKKGCLLTVMEVTPNRKRLPSSLNIYSTHLNAAGSAKHKQIFELVGFVWKTMNKVKGNKSGRDYPNLNANILAGDFNLARNSKDVLNTNSLLRWSVVKNLPTHLRRAVIYKVSSNGEISNTRVNKKNGYEILRDLLAVLGFKDLWVERNGTEGYTSNLERSEIAKIIAKKDPKNPFYCDDNIDMRAVARLEKPPKAIDHVFVTSNTDKMSFTIDYTRPRRPHIERPNAVNRKFKYLSDHLGISSNILITPK